MPSLPARKARAVEVALRSGTKKAIRRLPANGLLLRVFGLRSGDLAAGLPLREQHLSLLQRLKIDPRRKIEVIIDKAVGQQEILLHTQAVDDVVIQAQLQARQAARAARDFERADAIRDQLTAAGIAIEDTASGPRWSLVRRTVGGEA